MNKALVAGMIIVIGAIGGIGVAGSAGTGLGLLEDGTLSVVVNGVGAEHLAPCQDKAIGTFAQQADQPKTFKMCLGFSSSARFWVPFPRTRKGQQP